MEVVREVIESYEAIEPRWDGFALDPGEVRVFMISDSGTFMYSNAWELGLRRIWKLGAYNYVKTDIYR